MLFFIGRVAQRLCIANCGLHYLNVCDTAAESDVERYLPIAKRSLELFLACYLKSKYAAEMVDTIYKLQHKLSPEAAVSALSGNSVCPR